MTTATTGYPTAGAPAAPPAPVTMTLTDAELAEVDALYAQLKPMATAAAREYVLARTPGPYQEAMAAKIEADWPVPDEAPAAQRRAETYAETSAESPA